mmetsp:Transcript_8240/g.10140  ORF Transcript_8240/g.10140 Transcript_8240/m.10140 type:complete len:894 (+) Transcript_8240:260-2941(+)|eukprot:CAMPEP_0172499318 /NCGR_PEP_ID=MMETSP1066-20121228/125505_1 /TAXON_ID=671091 /ORGANISM="Coscinodiscus wailesii, Strain CCMP2513" /LENGTH=893 /DNA_ID=CAMNT_0013272995 /DNA_START=255 /DNA_END=2936 /DNA_ORIENTATION=+
MPKGKKIRPRGVTLDPYESALIVEYSVETVVDDTISQTSKTKTREIKRSKIWLNNVIDDDNNDPTKLAVTIISQCRYLDGAWAQRVRDVITDLQSRQRRARGDDDDDDERRESRRPSSSSAGRCCSSSSSSGGGGGSSSRPSRRGSSSRLSVVSSSSRRSVVSSSEGRGTTDEYDNDDDGSLSMDNIEEYLEMLYASPSEKINGTKRVLALCRQSVSNLETLVRNHTLMSALSRTLRDDSKDSTALCLALLKIFLALSHFGELHEILSAYKVGSLTLSALDLEVRRSRHRFRHIRRRGSVAGGSGGGATPPMDVRREVEGVAVAKRRDLVIFVCLRILANLSSSGFGGVVVEMKMVKKNFVQMLGVCLYRRSKRCLLLVLSFLKRLTIYERNVREILALELEKNEGHCRRKGKEEDEEEGSDGNGGGVRVIDRLVALVRSNDVEVVGLVLGVIFQLSFDRRCREVILRSSSFSSSHGGSCCHSRLAKLLLLRKSLRMKVLRVLYHLSLSQEGRERLCSRGDVVNAVIRLLIHSPSEKRVGKELVALAINMSTNSRCALRMLQQGAVANLITRIEKHRDLLSAKLLRQLSRYTHSLQIHTLHLSSSSQPPSSPSKDIGEEQSTVTETSSAIKTIRDNATYRSKQFWRDHTNALLQLCLDPSNDHDLLVELLGTVAHLTTNDISNGTTSWADLATTYSLPTFIHKLLLPGMAEGDIISTCLEITRRLLCHDDDSIRVLLRHGGDNGGVRFLQVLDGVWDDEDTIAATEVRWRCLATFKRLCFLREAREVLLYETRAVEHIENCTHDSDSYVRATAKECLDLIVECDRNDDGSWGRVACHVRENRFLSHNEQWWSEVVGEEEIQTGTFSYQGDGFDETCHSYDTGDHFGRWETQRI